MTRTTYNHLRYPFCLFDVHSGEILIHREIDPSSYGCVARTAQPFYCRADTLRLSFCHLFLNLLKITHIYFWQDKSESLSLRCETRGCKTATRFCVVFTFRSFEKMMQSYRIYSVKTKYFTEYILNILHFNIP